MRRGPSFATTRGGARNARGVIAATRESGALRDAQWDADASTMHIFVSQNDSDASAERSVTHR
eukprot:14845073-Alexandrium_andersonii.AAC.1